MYPPLDVVLGPDTEYSHLFNANYGAGAAIQEEVGLYHTWQYALFKNMFGRLLVSKYRTRWVLCHHQLYCTVVSFVVAFCCSDPTEADAFIIPFDIGAHGYMDELTGRTRRGGHFAAMATSYLEIASKDPVSLLPKNVMLMFMTRTHAGALEEPRT